MGLKQKLTLLILTFLFLLIVLQIGFEKIIKPMLNTSLYEQISNVVDWRTMHEQLFLKSDEQYHTEYDEEETIQRNTTNERVDVMLFAYARGGSTYVGQILGHNDGAFYFYEPLWTKEGGLKYYRNNYVCEMNSIACRYNASTDISSYLNKIKSVYGCELNAFSNIFVTDWHRHVGGPAWKLPHTSSNKNKLYQEKCIKSNSRVAKVLRITGEDIDSLLISNTKLKVVYLYRDPRGIINSRLKMKFRPIWNVTMGTVKQLADGLCRKMEMDSKVIFKLIEIKYPKRIIRVAYEDIVKNPTQSIKDIFSFLEVNISENYLNKVSDMGKHDGTTDREWNSVFRANGLSTAMKWNQELSNLDKQAIDQSCALIYKRFGYQVSSYDDT